MTKDQLKEKLAYLYRTPAGFYPGQHLVTFTENDGEGRLGSIMVEKINDGTITGRQPVSGNLLTVPVQDVMA